jgi:VanZ family protein
MSPPAPHLAPPPRPGTAIPESTRISVPPRPGAKLRWAIWLLYVSAWSAALLTPHPVHLAHALIPAAYQFVCSKALHVVAYALWAVLSGWLRVPFRLRGALLGLLFVHAFASEFFQRFVPLRHPSWADVGIDSIGIILGLALTCRLWLARR